MKFDKVALWIQLHHLPLASMNGSDGKKIENTLEKVEAVNVHDNNIGWGHSLRVKVKMDLTNPIACGRTIMIKGMKQWILKKYEKLPRV